MGWLAVIKKCICCEIWLRERSVSYDCLEVVCTEDGKHTETEVIRQCLLAEGVVRRARSLMAISMMYLCMYT